MLLQPEDGRSRERKDKAILFTWPGEWALALACVGRVGSNRPLVYPEGPSPGLVGLGQCMFFFWKEADTNFTFHLFTFVGF